MARDAAPSRAFEPVAKRLEDEGYTVHQFLGNGEPIDNEEGVGEAVSQSNFVLVGMSSSLALSAPEWDAAIMAFEKGVPFGLYSDTFGCYRRQHFANIIPQTSLLLVIDEEDRCVAEREFADTVVRLVPNPVWQSFFNPPHDRQAARRLLGLTEDDFAVFVPGSKTARANLEVLNYVQAAMEQSRRGRLIFGKHPGDRAPEESYAGFTTCPLTTAEAVIGMDLVVSGWSSSTDVQALTQRVPVINVIGSENRARLLAETGIDDPVLVTRGLVTQVSIDPNDLVPYLAHPPVAPPCPFEQGDAVEAIVSALKEMC